jgi:lipoprotein-anchoring transpeptidase ErfK/SrfK
VGFGIRKADGRGSIRGSRRAIAGATLALPLALAAACSSGGHTAAAGSNGTASAKLAAVAPATVTASPAANATSVDPSVPVKVSVGGGKIQSVALTSSSGGSVAGTVASDGKSWTNSDHLALSTNYTLRVTATNEAGKTTQKTESFTTLTPSEKLTIQQYMPNNGDVVGVGQPIMVQFTNYVPTAYRAAIEHAMTVTTTPGVSGAWSWVSDSRVDWRPATYWKPGTKVHVDLNLDGVRAGEHQFGWENREWTFTIGSDVRADVNATTHEMKVYKNGSLIKTIPVDTGMPGFSTWGGTMVVLDKEYEVKMTSCSVGISCTPGVGDYYDMDVYWDVHLTDSGTYMHAAPWDSQIGEADSSHGCIHLRTADAEYMYNLLKPGDVVTVTGEPQTVAEGNGYGDWNVSWAKWLANSATGVTTNGVPASGSTS